MRCDRVDFPPGGVAYLHTHPGPGPARPARRADPHRHAGRVARVRAVRVVVRDRPRSRCSRRRPRRSRRRSSACSCCRREWAGKRTIAYVDPADEEKPKLQRAPRLPRAARCEPPRRQAPRRPARRPRRRHRSSASRARASSRCSTASTTRRSGSITCRHEAGAANMADAYGKLTGRPGICRRHARPGRDARVGRRAHRVPGLDAADPARRPGRLGPGGARGVPGGRLPAHVRADGEVGRADRPRRPHSRVRRARVLDRVRGAARARSCSRCPRTCSRARPTSPDAEPFHVVQPHPGAAQIERLRGLLDAAERPFVVARRRRLDAARRAGHARASSRRTSCPRARVPPPGRARQRLAELRRRRRHRHQPEARRARPRRRPAARVGPRLGEMTTSGYTLLEPPTPRRRSCTSIPAPRSSAASTSPTLPILSGMEQFAARRARPPRRAALARVDRARRAPTTRRGSSPARCPGTLDLGDVHRARSASACPTRSSRTAPATSRVWVHRFWRYHELSDASSRRRAARWATACRRRSPRRLVAPGADGDLLRRRRRLPDERPGARDRGAVRRCRSSCSSSNNGMYGTIRMHQERHYPGPRRRHRARQPGLRRLRARLRRARRDGDRDGAVRGRVRARARRRAARRCSSCSIDPEAINPRTTLSRDPGGALQVSGREEIRVPGWPSRSATTRMRCAPATCCSSRAASRSTATGGLVGGDDVVAQTRQVFANLGAVLAAAGATFADVVKVTVYLTDIDDRARDQPGAAGDLRRVAAREHARRGERARRSRARRSRSKPWRCPVSDAFNAVITEVEPAPGAARAAARQAAARQGPDRHRRRSARRTARRSTRTTCRRAPRPRSSGSSPRAPSSSARRTCTSSRGA